jgi:cell division protein ZapD
MIMPAESPHSVIVYEYPFNERARTYLRLEHLFERLGILLAREAALDHHFALATIFEIIEVGARSDLKSELLKDLEKHKQQFNAYRGNPAIAESALDEVIGQLEQAFSALNGQPGKAGNTLNENEWVVSVRSRIGIPAGTCEFDLPAYYHWQHHSVDQRRKDLSRWASSLWPLAQSVNLLLKLLRDSGSAQKVMANAGQFQQTLPQGRSFQLLRLRIDPALGLIPEISGNRLMVSVRFLRESGEDKLPSVSNEDASFELTLCS